MRRLTFFVVLTLLLFGLWRLNRPVRTSQEVPPDALASPNEGLIQGHPDLMPEQVAVLLLRKSEQAFPAARVLEAAGLPFTVTRDAEAALRHRMVFVPLDDQPTRLPRSGREAFRQYVSSGGVLILQMPAADLWPELTGLARSQASRSRRGLVWRAMSDPGLALFDRPEELTVPLASSRVRLGPWSAALFPLPGSDTQVLASFTGTSEPALVRRSLGAGSVYVLGVHLRDLFVRPQSGRDFDAHRSTVNGFEPGTDVWPLMFRAWYEAAQPFWLRLRTAPGRARSVFLLSHSFGPGASVSQAEEFSALESSYLVRATWFFQTSVMADDPSSQFFDARLRGLARQLARAGHEIGSHSVACSPDFESLPLNPAPQDPHAYRPDVDARGFTRDASLFGELGVSKAILDRALASGTVAGFRSPDSSYPQALDLALARTGYAYDSSLLANGVMTHLPFRLVAWRAMTRETELVELPITFTEPRKPAPPLTAPALLDTARTIAERGGWNVWSLTPDGRPEQTALLRQVLADLPKDYEVMVMREAARFWLARSRARFSFAPGPRAKEWVLRLDLPAGSPALSFQASGPLRSCVTSDRAVKVFCVDDILVVDAPQARRAEVRLSLR